MFDLSVLPQKAQEELADFYQFLVERYGKKERIKENEFEAREKRINAFFGKFNLNLNDYTFNRDEIYER